MVKSPPLLGLTGGIGSGKSTALDAFAALGAAVLSSDEIVHRLYRRPEVRDAVAERFGEAVLRDGEVDRALLGPAAFADPGGIAFLEDLTHPLIGPERELWARDAAEQVPAPPVLVCEVPLLFEADVVDQFDAVVVVTAAESIRRRRVVERGQGFDARASRQLDEAEKVARADESYVNDGSLEDLRAWAVDVIARWARPGSGAPT